MARAPLVDTHAHLDDAAFAVDREAVLERALAAGVVAIIAVGVDLRSSAAAIALSERHQMVWAAVGIHPSEAARCDSDALVELRRLARHPRVVAVGEIGLDYYRDRAPRATQRAAFQHQLRLAVEVGLPVIVHDREAHEDTLRLLEEQRLASPTSTGVLHCFSGDVGMALAASALNMYLSIAGPVTYPKADRLGEVVRLAPMERLVAETDCPYLAPQSARGRRNEPARVRDTVQRMAELRGRPMAEMASLTTDNARRLFGLGLPAL